MTMTMTRPARTLPAEHDLARAARDLEGSPPDDVLRWALDTYHPRVTLACSFGGVSGMVLLDMVMALDVSVPVFYLDTGFLFPETYDLVERAAARYGIRPRPLRPALTPLQQAATHGNALWARDPDHCCALRKVAPQREALRGMDAWITGLRRDQAATRRATPVVQWDSKFGLAKVNPLVGWDERAVWRYVADHDVPYNPLHDRGYPSLGCTHCTRPVAAGEDLRAGRWSGFAKVECGLHTA